MIARLYILPDLKPVKTKDPRIVCGATCTWWDSIEKVGRLEPRTQPVIAMPAPADGVVGLPCCPHCNGVLYEYSNEQGWWDGAARFEVESEQPGYREVLKWARGKCFADKYLLGDAYLAETGKEPPPIYKRGGRIGPVQS